MKFSFRNFAMSGQLQLLLALSLFICSYIFIQQQVTSLNIIFDTDEYAHATPALDFLVYFKNGQWIELFSRVQQEAFYPPLFPLLLSIVYFIFGVSDVVARSFPLSLYFFSIVVTAWAAFKITTIELSNRSAGRLAASTVILLGITAPAPILNSTICMVESLGMLIVALLLHQVIRLPNKLSTSTSALVIALLAALIFLIKYTFLVLVLPGLFLGIISCSSNKHALQKAFRYVATIASVLAMIIMVWYIFADRTQINYYLFGYQSRGYTFGLIALLFYPKVLLTKYFYHISIGCFFLILILASLRATWNKLWFRTCLLIIIFSVQIFAMLYEKSPRHIMPIVPCLWLISSYGLSVFCYRSWNVSPQIGRLAGSFILLPIFICFVVISQNNSDKITHAIARNMEYIPEVNKAIVELSQKFNTCCEYYVDKGRFSKYYYYLDWNVAKKEMLTLAQAKHRRIANVP